MNIRTTLTRATLTAGLAAAAALGMVATATASTSAANIGYGRSTAGDQVWCVQHSLNYFVTHSWVNRYPRPPYEPSQFSEDSQWGPKTEAMVKWFQDLWETTNVDGIVGPMTGDVLVSVGDQYYNAHQQGYCYWRIPTTS
ncbi:peptidoglycan-binding protein [Streptomyces sp. NPDC008163]|uniref:peptidoglycan-binding domain-containing protein n=1 Tax=Streptomyces sp. NPDC008163 TaxID=3364818 RepID=UPI0036F13BF9